MTHVHKLVRFSNGDIIVGEVLEESLRYDSDQVQITNVFKVHQIVSPEAYQMTTMVKFLHFIKDQYISLNKEHISFISEVTDDVVEYIENYDEEDEVDEEDFFDKMATAGLYANTEGSIH